MFFSDWCKQLTQDSTDWLYLAGMILFVVGDSIATYLFLSVGVTEANPFWAWIHAGDVWVVLLAKIIGAVILTKFYLEAKKHHDFITFLLVLFFYSISLIVVLLDIGAYLHGIGAI